MVPTGWLSALADFGQAAELLGRERRVTKQTAAAVREPLTRVAAAAAPLMRCSASAVVTATEQLLQAAGDVENTALLEVHWRCSGARPGAQSASTPARQKSPSWVLHRTALRMALPCVKPQVRVGAGVFGCATLTVVMHLPTWCAALPARPDP